MSPAVGLAIAYLLGSVPFAHLAGLAAGVDLRRHGSGNLGATNVVRVLGWKVGLPVFLLDVAKGAVPVLLLPGWTHASPADLWAIGFGVAAILGHVRPVFLLGKGGGKGVATAAGVFLALAPVSMMFTLGVFAVVLLTTGYVSLGSLSAAVTLVVSLAVFQGVRSPDFALSLAVALFVFWTHRANIGRLRRGEEHRFGRRAGGGGAPAANGSGGGVGASPRTPRGGGE
jgi:acyl phosphate:glycerol-3-phosphate acyltransferase